MVASTCLALAVVGDVDPGGAAGGAEAAAAVAGGVDEGGAAAGAVTEGGAGGVLADEVGETAGGVGADAVHDGAVGDVVVQVGWTAVVAGDVRGAGGIGEEEIQQLDAGVHIGRGEDVAEAEAPSGDGGGLVGAYGSDGHAVVAEGGQHGVGEERREVDERGGGLGAGTAVRVEVH
jgi:hypothetical protein